MGAASLGFHDEKPHVGYDGVILGLLWPILGLLWGYIGLY